MSRTMNAALVRALGESLAIEDDAPPQGVATLSARASQMSARADKLLGPVRNQPLYLRGYLGGSCSSIHRGTRHG